MFSQTGCESAQRIVFHLFCLGAFSGGRRAYLAYLGLDIIFGIGDLDNPSSPIRPFCGAAPKASYVVVVVAADGQARFWSVNVVVAETQGMLPWLPRLKAS